MLLKDFVRINPKTELVKGEKHSFVEMADLVPGYRHVPASQKRIYKGGGSRFQNGDILFARITPCLENGKIAQYQSEGRKKSFGSTEFIVLRNKKAISVQDFVYYLVLSDIVRKPAEKSMFGASGRQRVDLEVFGKIEIPSYTLENQKKIAGTLSLFDELIEVNLRRIKILEKIAQSIYTEWFVQLRYPGHEKAEIIHTPNGPLPKGWRWRKIGTVIELAYGKALKKTDRIPGDFPVYGSSGVVGSHETYLVEGPVVIVGRKGNVGSVFWSYNNCYPIDTVFYVKTHLPQSYIYFNFQQQNFIDSHAAVPGLSRTQAYELPILIPNQEVLKHFTEDISIIFDQIHALRQINEELSQVRELLLPKLISGKINVNKLDINASSD